MDFQKRTSAQELKDLFSALINDSYGDLNTVIYDFSTFNDAQENSLVFVTNEKKWNQALDCKAKTLLVPFKLKEQAEAGNFGKCFLFSKNPELAAREIKKNLVFSTPYKAPWKSIHPTAIIAESTQLAKDVVVGPYAVIGENCKIGEGSFIGSHAVIEENVIIGNNTTIHPHAYIGHSCEIGNNCEIKPQAIIGSEGFGYAHDHLGNHYRIPHTGKVILHDDVHIGAASAIDRGTLDPTIIGKGTKVDNQCHLAHNTVVGKNGLITAQIVTAGSSTIGDNFVAGGKSVITGHIKITDNVQLAGLTAVANNIDKPGQYGGYPVQPLRDFLKTKASTVHLPELRKQMNRVLRKLFPEEFS